LTGRLFAPNWSAPARPIPSSSGSSALHGTPRQTQHPGNCPRALPAHSVDAVVRSPRAHRPPRTGRTELSFQDNDIHSADVLFNVPAMRSTAVQQRTHSPPAHQHHLQDLMSQDGKSAEVRNSNPRENPGRKNSLSKASTSGSRHFCNIAREDCASGSGLSWIKAVGSQALDQVQVAEVVGVHDHRQPRPSRPNTCRRPRGCLS